MDRIRRLSELALEKHRDAFGPDYDKNKEALEEMAFIPSKQLRNHIAGYIARVLREEPAEEEAQNEETAE